MNQRHVTDQGQLLADLARAGAEDRQEASIVISPGAGATAWAVKITSHAAYNVYNVRAVAIGAASTTSGPSPSAPLARPRPRWASRCRRRTLPSRS